MSKKPVALLDANILYPPQLQDLFLQLAADDLYQAKWTDDIHEEWIDSVLKDNPHIQRKSLEYTRAEMDRAIKDCLIAGYEEIIPTLALPDTDDRHVSASRRTFKPAPAGNSPTAAIAAAVFLREAHI